MSGSGAHRMNMIGSSSGECYEIAISHIDDNADKILSLLVVVDQSGVRTLNVNLKDGKARSYGYDFYNLKN